MRTRYKSDPSEYSTFGQTVNGKSVASKSRGHSLTGKGYRKSKLVDQIYKNWSKKAKSASKAKK